MFIKYFCSYVTSSTEFHYYERHIKHRTAGSWYVVPPSRSHYFFKGVGNYLHVTAIIVAAGEEGMKVEVVIPAVLAALTAVILIVIIAVYCSKHKA